MRKWIVGFAGVLVGVTCAAAPALAQNAQIAGRVTDTAGLVIPGAAVTAGNIGTGFTRTATSEADGTYRLQSLPPGAYAVTAELAGFTTETKPDIVLVIDQTAVVNFTLKPAVVAETVTIVGESPLVDMSKSDVSSFVSTRQIQDLPVASRRSIDLAMLTPGASQDNIRGFFFRGNVNLGAGTREYSNMFMVDGVNNTWAEMGEPRQNFAMDAIQEFKVSTSNYKAEYGLATGGILTVVTRSGTNRLQGSGLLFFRDASITEREHFQAFKPPYRRYQYGGTAGGPIARNRTHFFAAYEGTKESEFFTVNAQGLWPQYEGTYESAQTRWTYTAKVDHQLTTAQSLFFRWGGEGEYRPIIQTGGRVTPSATFDFAVPRRSGVVAHTWVLSASALNDVRFQYAFAKYEVSPPYSHGDWAPADVEPRLPYCTDRFDYPSILVGGCGNSQMGPETRWQLKDDFSYLMRAWGGRHQWKTGFDFSNIAFEADNIGSPLGTWTFPKDQPYAATDRATWPTQFTSSLPIYASIPVKVFAGYVQDDWQVKDRLTLNLGVRYDLQRGSFNEDVPALLSKIQAKLGRNGAFPIDVSVVKQPTRQRGDRNNVGPRIGLAWDPANDGVTNVHAAYGLFYDNVRTLLNFDELTWPQAQTITITSDLTFPDPYGGPSREAFLSTVPPTVTVGSNDQVNPYAHQFNVGVNRGITRDVAVAADVTLVNRFSDRNNPPTDINLPDPITRVRPYPQFGRLLFWTSTADNTYRALLLKVEKRMTGRYQFLVSYTLSKTDDDSFVGTLADHYGYTTVTRPGVGDRRHRLVTSGILALPLDTQLSAIADFRSSLPFTPTSTAGDLNGDTIAGDLPPGVLPGSGCRSLNLAAINAFRRSRNLTEVATVDCPTFANIDVRFSKFFSAGGSRRIEFLMQLFNIANRANLATPQAGILSGNDRQTNRPLFGTPTTLAPNLNAPSRQGEFAIRVQF